MAGICKFCGFSGTNDMMEKHASECPVMFSEEDIDCSNGDIEVPQKSIRLALDQNVELFED